MGAIKNLLKTFLIMIVAIFVISFVVGALFSFGFPSQHFALVKISGDIVTERSTGIFSSAEVSSDEIAELTKSLASDPSVVGVIFEINSGGGSTVASQEMYLSILELDKPKVAYIREVGASGGYYVALGADKIIANPDSLVGSIGAVIYTTDLSGLFEKIGINYTVIKSGEVKDIGVPSRPMTDKEKQLLQEMINESFDEFKSVVVERRPNMSMSLFNEMLDARVISGRKAKLIGLVDDTGTIKIAVKTLAELANVSETLPVVDYSKEEKNILSMLLSQVVSGIIPKEKIGLRMQMFP